MNRTPFAQMLRGGGISFGLGVLCVVVMTATGQPSLGDSNLPVTEITNVHQLRVLTAQIPRNVYAIRLEGDVWWAHPSDGRFVLKDDSGAEELEIDPGGQTFSAGQRVRLEGVSTVMPTGTGLRLGTRGAVV